MLDFLFTLIIFPITQIIEFVFVVTQKIFKEAGISIFAVSGAISVLCLPIYKVAEHWQQIQRQIEKDLKSGIDKIKSAYKGDKQYMLLSTFYKQNHYHPIHAMRSTFGVLFQIPFFIAAYFYLSHLNALQGVQFFIIKNLGAPDALLNIGGFTINILPILMTAVNCISGAVYTKGLNAKERFQLYAMAVVFLVLLYNSPAGLVLYWTMNNIFNLIKNIYSKIKIPHKKIILYTIITSACFALSVFLAMFFRGDKTLKITLSLVFAAAGILPLASLCLKPIIKKTYLQTSTSELFSLFIFSFGLLFVTAGIFIPSMLIVSSPQEFSYLDNYTSPLFFIFHTAMKALGFFVFWPLCLYFLFNKKVKTLFSILSFIASIYSLFNVFLFPGHYGLITAELIFSNDVSSNISETISSIVILAAIFVLAFLFVKKNMLFKIISMLSLFSISIFSTYNIISINKAYNSQADFHYDHNNKITKLEPIFNLSKNGQNIVVIMLDRGNSAFVPYIMEELPQLKEIYQGFIYYPNTVSFNGYTKVGAPPIFGGYDYTPTGMDKRDNISAVIKHNEALLLMPRIFSENGFAVTVTDPPYPNYSFKEDLRIYDDYPSVHACITDSVYTDMWIKEKNFPFQSISETLKRNLFMYSIFKIMPPALRRGIYYKGDWLTTGSGQRLRLTLDAYSVLDFLHSLTAIKEKNENTALLMVNNTTHENALLQAPEYRPAVSITNYGTSKFRAEPAYHVNAAALLRVGEWLQFLKENNVYDNTRIIIVADHGCEVNFVNDIGLPFALDSLNPMLFVKDFNTNGNLKTDNTFMTNADVPSIALQNIVENPVNPWTHNPVNMEAKKEPLYIAISGSVHRGNPNEKKSKLNAAKDYYVHDNIFDPKNWTKAEGMQNEKQP